MRSGAVFHPRPSEANEAKVPESRSNRNGIVELPGMEYASTRALDSTVVVLMIGGVGRSADARDVLKVPTGARGEDRTTDSETDNRSRDGPQLDQ
jgi:hypothetical protein